MSTRWGILTYSQAVEVAEWVAARDHYDALGQSVMAAVLEYVTSSAPQAPLVLVQLCRTVYVAGFAAGQESALTALGTRSGSANTGIAEPGADDGHDLAPGHLAEGPA